MTKNFTLEEMVFSQTAVKLQIDNALPQAYLRQMTFTALGAERLRAALCGFGIQIMSGYRCPDLNAAVGGQTDSQHLKAEAIDFICPKFGDPRAVARCLSALVRVIGIDQLILERTWVHASFTWQPRYEVLTIQNGVTIKGIL